MFVQIQRTITTIPGHRSGTPNPHNFSEKYWQYTSNLYRSTPAICNAVPCWLLSLEETEAAAHLQFFLLHVVLFLFPFPGALHTRGRTLNTELPCAHA